MARTLPRGPANADRIVTFALFGIIDAIRGFVQGGGPEYQAEDIEATAYGLRESRHSLRRLRHVVEPDQDGNIWTNMMTGGSSGRTVNPAKKRGPTR